MGQKVFTIKYQDSKVVFRTHDDLVKIIFYS